VLKRCSIDDESRTDIAAIRESAVRGAALVRCLQPGADSRSVMKPEPLSINDAVRGTSRLLAHRLGETIGLHLDLHEPGGRVRIDPSQLDRVLLNLIANASHAMPQGGTVTLRTVRRAIVAPDHRFPDSIPTGEYAVISVADTGAGIPPDRMPRIFEPGVSYWESRGGSGLGLSSTLDIVHRANGFLSVESVQGRGTIFEIYLPLETNDPGPSSSVERRSGNHRPVVLLVDDDRLVRQFTERMLRRAGWIVLAVSSAAAALDLLAGSDCDLMVSDVSMPDMDGFTLTRLVLDRRPDFPIILTSGYEGREAAERFGTSNVVFLSKPFQQADLLAAVTQITRARPAQAASANKCVSTPTKPPPKQSP
jgi:two-component system cell cycle sensor histidine kinase/response regulator CckA